MSHNDFTLHYISLHVLNFNKVYNVVLILMTCDTNMTELKHIAVNETTYNKLKALKPHPRAGFSEVIEKLLSENTQKEHEEAEATGDSSL